MEVAETVLEQLGGNKFIAMTGASEFIGDTNSLQMKLPRNKSKANRLTVKLMPDDTYMMSFIKWTAPRVNRKTWEYTDGKKEEITVFCGVFWDKLQDLFTEVTGLETHL